MFSVDFKRNRNSRNIRSELWRRSLIKAEVQSTIICLPISIKTVFLQSTNWTMCIYGDT